MLADEYKDQSDIISGSSKNSERDAIVNNQLDESRLSKSPLLSQCSCDIINNFISSALVNFNEKNFSNYFSQLNLMISFLNQLSEAETDLNDILPDIFDLNLNNCLINSIKPEQFHIQNINEVLSLITILSSYTKNFDFFRNYSILEIVYNLLKLNDEVIFQNSILIINIYLSTYDTRQFPLDLDFLIKILKNLSTNVLFCQYIVDTINNIILYIDITNYMKEILYLLNCNLLKSISIHTFNGVIKAINNIFDMDSLNIYLIFQSKIIHNFIRLLKRKFIQKPLHYQTTIELFFKLVYHICDNINVKWQEIILIKMIGIDLIDKIFEKVHDDKILFIIHLILIQYIYSLKNFEEILPFVVYFIHIGLVSDLVKKFNDQNFKIKKLFLIVIHKLLKTRSYEIFCQLLKSEDVNYFETLNDFISDNDDVECQTLYLETLIFLVQISEQTDEKHLLSSCQIINDFVSIGITSEVQKVQLLSQEFYNLLYKD